MFTALLALGLAAPVPKAKPEPYFPVKEGTKRVMVQTAGGHTVESTETVTRVEEKDGKRRVSVDHERGGKTTPVVYEVSDQGVFRVGTGGKDGEAEPLIKLPVNEGDTWEVKGADERTPERCTYTVGKEEAVEVAAGKFQAVRVDCEIDLGNGRTQKNAVWYASGVGVVKIESRVNARTITQELKEFTPGR